MLSIVVSTTLLLTGCWGGYGTGGGSGNSGNYTQVFWENPDEVINDNSYEGGHMPFTIRSSDLQAPLLSRKGQVVWDSYAGSGIGTSLAAATGEKTAIYFRGSKGKFEDSETLYDEFILRTKTYESHQLVSENVNSYVKPIALKREVEQGNAELGFGIYNANRKHLRHEHFIGVNLGWGESKYILDPRDDRFDSYEFKESRNFQQYFIQSNLGWVTNNIEFAFILRSSVVNFNSISYQADHQVNTSNETGPAFALEPSIRFGIGGRTMRIYIQTSRGFAFGNDDLEWVSPDITGGITFRFGDKIKLLN